MIFFDDEVTIPEYQRELAYLRRHPLTVGNVPTTYPELKAMSVFEPRHIQIWKYVKNELQLVEPPQRLTNKPHIFRVVEGAPILPSTDGRYCRFILVNDAGEFRQFWVHMRHAENCRDAIEARLSGATRYDGDPCPECGQEEYFAEKLSMNLSPGNGRGRKFGYSKCCGCKRAAKAKLLAEMEARWARCEERHDHYEGLSWECRTYGRQSGGYLWTAADRREAWEQIARDAREYDAKFDAEDYDDLEPLEWAGWFHDHSSLRHFREEIPCDTSA